MLGNDMDTNTRQDQKPFFDSNYFGKPMGDMSKSTSSDGQFQSGMIVNNDKLIFKLEDPTKMCSSDVSQTYPRFNKDDIPSLISLSDTSSIIVLDKDSLNLIQSSSLSSFIDIQQKCKSVDYNSIISSLSSIEMQKKLAGVLEENVKFKETLKQNNTFMRQQLNALAMRQTELVKVCQNHKQKFVETKELISNLRNENTSLKLELSAAHTGELKYDILRSTCTQTTPSEGEESGAWESCDKMHTHKEKQSTVASNFTSFEKLLDQSIGSIGEQSMKAKNFEVTDKRDLADSSYVTSSHSKLLESNEKQTDEINVLKKFMALSKEISQKLSMCESLSNTVFTDDYQRFLDKVPQYNTRSQDFKRSFDYCASLVKDQDILTSNIEVFIKVQEEFLQILMDYSKILWKLKTALKENPKLTEIINSLTEKTSELEKFNSADNHLPEEKEDTLREERAFLNDQWASLRLEQQNLIKEQELLEDERSLLHKEKKSLDVQCKLYTKEQKTLHIEKNLLEKQRDKIIAKMNAFFEKKHDITVLEKQLEALNQENNLMKEQLICYEDDFKEEQNRVREMRDRFIESQNVLYEKLQHQIDLNKQLLLQIPSNTENS